MGIRAFLSGALWMLASLVAFWLLSGLQASAYTAGVWSGLRWLPVAMLGFGLLLSVAPCTAYGDGSVAKVCFATAADCWGARSMGATACIDDALHAAGT